MPKDFKPAQGSGDLGLTDLLGGRRVPKTDRRVKLNALIDELSALLGLLKTAAPKPGLKKDLALAQAGLQRAAALVAGLKGGLEAETLALEAASDALSAKVRPPKKFVLPGRSETEALAHLARAKARICEILAWELKAKAAAVYLNRLSDYLFLAALAVK